jgi:hypothetical protein
MAVLLVRLFGVVLILIGAALAIPPWFENDAFQTATMGMGLLLAASGVVFVGARNRD